MAAPQIAANEPVDQQQDQQQQQPQSPAAAAAADDGPRPITQWWRWVIFVFSAGCIGCGVAAILLNTWVTATGLEFGLWKMCLNGNCVEPTYEACASGMGTKERFLMVRIIACCGSGFAFFAWFFTFCSSSSAAMTWLRHVCTFIAMGCWATVMPMWYAGWPSCGGPWSCGTGECGWGIAFWLGVAAGGSAVVAFFFDLFQHIGAACCGPKPTAQSSVDQQPAGAAGAAQQQQQQQQPASAATTVMSQQQQPQQQQQAREMDPAQQLDYSNAHAPAAGAGDISGAAVGAEGGEKNPADVGLSEDWYFVDEYGFWYSEQAGLYYDADTQAYGNPEDGTWYNSQTGEWE